jgi:hypothetical protein
VHAIQKGVRRPAFAVLLIVAAALLIQPALAQVDNVYIVTTSSPTTAAFQAL